MTVGVVKVGAIKVFGQESSENSEVANSDTTPFYMTIKASQINKREKVYFLRYLFSFTRVYLRIARW